MVKHLCESSINNLVPTSLRLNKTINLKKYVSGQHLCYDEELRATGELRKACSKRGTPLQPASRTNTTSRLISLRGVMNSSIDLADFTIDALLITSDDEHQVGSISNNLHSLFHSFIQWYKQNKSRDRTLRYLLKGNAWFWLFMALLISYLDTSFFAERIRSRIRQKTGIHIWF